MFLHFSVLYRDIIKINFPAKCGDPNLKIDLCYSFDHQYHHYYLSVPNRDYHMFLCVSVANIDYRMFLHFSVPNKVVMTTKKVVLIITITFFQKMLLHKIRLQLFTSFYPYIRTK